MGAGSRGFGPLSRCFPRPQQGAGSAVGAARKQTSAVGKLMSSTAALAPRELLPDSLAREAACGLCRFLLQSLEDLDTSLRKLNSRLFVVRGQPADVFPRLFKVRVCGPREACPHPHHPRVCSRCERVALWQKRERCGSYRGRHCWRSREPRRPLSL